MDHMDVLVVYHRYRKRGQAHFVAFANIDAKPFQGRNHTILGCIVCRDGHWGVLGVFVAHLYVALFGIGNVDRHWADGLVPLFV